MGAPTVRRRRLGAELRRLRENLGLTLDDVEARGEINSAKLSRVETARIGAKADDVKYLLDLYGVTEKSDPAKRVALLSLAREGSKRGWWKSFRDVLSPVYEDLISLEAEASGVRSYQRIVPGLLQTAAYARSVIAATNMTDTPERVNALVEVRMARQSVLTRPTPLEVWAIIDEAALLVRVAGMGVMRDQLQRLLDLSELPHVNIQVMPSEASPHPGYAGGFEILAFPEAMDLDVVLVEGLSTSLWLEELPDVQTYGAAFERLRAEALSFDESQKLIAQVKDRTQ